MLSKLVENRIDKPMPTIGPKTIRITARVPSEMRETLEEAAQLQGATLNQFVVQSVFQDGKRTSKNA